MDYAAQQSPRAVRSKLDLRNADVDRTQAILSHLPSLSGGISAGAGFGRTINPADNTYADVANFSNNYSLSASVVIFQGLSLLNNTRIARIQQLRGAQSLQQTIDQVALETMQAFFELNYAEGAVSLGRQQLATSEHTLRQTRRMMELGLKSVADVAQVDADVAANRYNLTKLENQTRTLLLRLKEKMNFPSAGHLNIDTTAYADGIGILAETEDPDRVVNRALASLPEALNAEMNQKMMRIRLTTARAKLFPSISASGGVGTSYYTNIDGRDVAVKAFKSQFPDNISENIGLSMSIPIFSSLSNQFNIKRARNNYESAKQQTIETRRKLATEIESAIMELEGAISEQQQAIKQVSARTLAYRTARQKYDEGLLSAIDLQTTSNQLLAAHAALLQTRLTSQLKRRMVDYYKGVPLVNPIEE